ncbi:MAG: TPM domain-containing protein [Thermodesulfobacteriota bacterium]
MKKNLFLKNICRLRFLPFICGLILLANLGTAKAEIKYPKPTGAVNDLAGIISPDYEKQMESLSHEVLQKTGTSIVVATVETVGDIDYSIYANDLYQAWGIGKKGEDKGVLIFLALKERKLKIETGYGVEGILPDGLVGQIRDDYMVPYLKKNEFGQGILNGLTILAAIIAKDAGVKLSGMDDQPIVKMPVSKKRISALGFLPILFFIVLFLILARSRTGGILPLLLLMMMGGRGGGFGGSFGGFGGGFGGFGGGSSGGGGAGGSF